MEKHVKQKLASSGISAPQNGQFFLKFTPSPKFKIFKNYDLFPKMCQNIHYIEYTLRHRLSRKTHEKDSCKTSQNKGNELLLHNKMT